MIPDAPSPRVDASPVQRLCDGLRHPGRWLDTLTGDGPVKPLLILFGLNAVDELARMTFSVTAPTIADSFGVGITGITVPFAFAFGAALALSVPIASIADRGNRVRIALIGGIIFAVFSALVGLSVSIWMVALMLAGSQIGKAFIEPSHTSLLADYYEVGLRPRVFAFYRAGNAIGALLGGIMAGYAAATFGWRVPFFAFAVPALVLVIAGASLPEPRRGVQEKKLVGADLTTQETEEPPPSLAEAWRMCWQIDSLRRIYRVLPFLTPAVAGFGIFSTFLYRDAFGLGEAGRGWVLGLVEGPAQLIGLTIGARLGMRYFARDPKLVFGLLAKSIFIASGCMLVFAWAPTLWLSIAANLAVSACLAFVVPGVFAALSVAIPARARSTGFAMGSLFVLAGTLTIPIVSLIGEAWGIRWGLTILVPVFLVGGLVMASAGDLITRDIAQVWNASAARSEVLRARREGRARLLLVRGLNVSYGDVQVLFDVDLEVDEGEVVALLGTNGAGKSTLLRSICGLVPANKGVVIFDGRDVTYVPPHEIAPRGVVLVPGGQGTFPSLTVAENLRAAGWTDRRRRRVVAERIGDALDTFPILRDLLHEPAANLSGGQQQMLGLAMALLSRPRLVMIDELSLGLAPIVVEQLVEIIRKLREAGTTIIVVEQSVNVALTIASEAYFMEKGQVRFHGPTEELLERPDVLRSVFLGGTRAPHAPINENGVKPRQGVDIAVIPDLVPALELTGVRCSFGGNLAVDDVSLKVAPREIVGVIGPNGAGKTTLLDLISGFAALDAGRIALGGRDITRMSASARARLGLGRSFQDGRLFPALTVEQCLAVALDRSVGVRDPLQPALHLPAAFDDEQRIDARVDELIALLGLEAFRAKFVHELSTGSRRIVELGCLIAHRPTTILLDEPSSGIAQRETEELGPVLLRLRDELGASLLVIEHDMPLVSSISDRLIAMELGRVIAQGPPDDVLEHPDVVAAYLGTTASLIQRSGTRTSTT